MNRSHPHSNQSISSLTGLLMRHFYRSLMGLASSLGKSSYRTLALALIWSVAGVVSLTARPTFSAAMSDHHMRTGQEIRQRVPAATGAGNVAHSLSGLPPGLSFNAANRIISGTATTAGTYTVAHTAQDNSGSTTQTCTFFVVSITPFSINPNNPSSNAQIDSFTVAGTDVAFTGISDGGQNPHWDFGDEGTDVGFMPTHRFPNHGLHTVKFYMDGDAWYNPSIATVIVPTTGDLPPTITSFTVANSPMIAGDSAQLKWVVSGATSKSIDQGIGSTGAATSWNVTPPSTTTYTLTAVNATGFSTSAVTVTVIPIVAVSVSPTLVVVRPGMTQAFTPTVTVTPAGTSTLVAWSVMSGGGGFSTGTSTNGVPVTWTAPSNSGPFATYTITATSQVRPSATVIATGQVLPPVTGTATVKVDGQAPVVTAAESGTAGTITLSAPTATDDMSVTKVEFYVDGVLKGTATSSPYSVSLDTTNPLLPNGSHTLVAKAYDPAGNIGISPTVNFTLANCVPVGITTQPANVAVVVPATATFTVTASGTGPFTYVWTRNGTAITGAPSLPSYTTPATTTADNNAAFTVVVTGACGSPVTSAAAILTVSATCTAPSITSHPASVSVTAGQTATFSVTATGTGPLTYQWKRNGNIISGAPSSPSYTTAPTTPADSGSTFSVVITNSCGTIASTAATLTVIPIVAVSVSPTLVVVRPGMTQAFTPTVTVTPAGTSTLVAWSVTSGGGGFSTGTSTNGVPVTWTAPSNTGPVATYTITATSQALPSATGTATVKVDGQAPVVTAAESGTAGTITLSAPTATDDMSVTKVEFYVDGVLKGTATTSPYSVSLDTTNPLIPNGSHTLVAKAYDPAGNIGSSSTVNFTLANCVPAGITTQPASMAVVVPASATFTVTASGTGPFTYVWKRNGTAISGAPSLPSYTTPATTTADNNAAFTVVVTGACGSPVTSAAAILTVSATCTAPSITSHPASVSVTAGQTATFSVTATGTGPLTYQWMWNGNPITGAPSTPSYTTAPTTTADSGSTFSVVITNSCGTIASTAATLTVASGAPSITTQPTNQSVRVGQTATFTVVATGAPVLAYQWSRGGTPITGATLPSYTTPATVIADNGATFVVTVTNSAGGVTSTTATLTVTAAGVFAWKRDIAYLGSKEVAEIDSTGAVHVTLVDHLGSPRYVIATDGTVESQQKYLPFGELMEQSGMVKTSKGFTNHEQTDLDGLIYMQARFYAPMYHRFLSPDPARDQHFEQTQSWNIYSYVQNNPVMMIDPTGMSETPQECIPCHKPIPQPTLPAPVVAPSHTSTPTSLAQTNQPSGALVAGSTALAAIPAEAPAATGAATWLMEGLGVMEAFALPVVVMVLQTTDAAPNHHKSEPAVPTDLVGTPDAKSGPDGKRYNNGPLRPDRGGTGDAQKDFDTLTGGNSRPAPPGSTLPEGSRIGGNKIQIRPGSKPGEGPRIDIPANGPKPIETLHY